MRSCYVAQGTIASLLRKNMMEDNIRKEVYIYIYKLGHSAVQHKLALHCKTTVL